MDNLVFHYQTVIHNIKDGIYLHEAFSTRTGELYSVNPVPVEGNGDNEQEVDESLRAMETDSTRYKPVKASKITKEMMRWKEEVELTPTVPHYDDEEELEDDYYDSEGEVLDLVDYMKRNK